MSIKVWTAYKIRRAADFWPLISSIRKQGEASTKKLLTAFFYEVMGAVKTDSAPYKKAVEQHLANAHLVKQYGKRKMRRYSEEIAKLDMADRLIRRGYRISSTSPLRSAFNFNVSVTFREHEGGIYVIPYCEGIVRDALDFLKTDKRLRDYHYQNQTDRPEEVPARQWRERRRVWEALTEHDRWPDFVLIEICSWDSWWQMNPQLDIHRELHRRLLK